MASRVATSPNQLNNHPKYKWYVLILTALTGTFVLAAPGMCLSVLFNEISIDLHLNLLQVGLIWSVGSLPGIFTSLLGGAITDRFGPKRVLFVSTLLLGLAGAMRGLAGDFPSLLVPVLLVGALAPLISTCAFKVCGLWFPRQQLGLANGVFTMGMAFGFLLASLISATVLSPWLGGWRNVMFFYGVLTLLLTIPWFFTLAVPPGASRRGSIENPSIPIRKAMAHILKLKNIWLLGLAILGMGGCMQGLTGYLPLYLRGLGWSGASSDGALALLHAMSMTFVVLLTRGSDRLKARKWPLLGMMLMTTVGSGMLSFSNGWAVWGAISLSGMVRDASMAIIMTMAVETEGVGPVYAGTATGFLLLCINIGSLIAGPVGNQFANVSPGLPFTFWAGMAALGIASLAFVKVSKSAHSDVNAALAESEA